MKGFTLLEILTVIFLLMVILGMTALVIKPQTFFQRTRDLKRMSDLQSLELAIKNYLLSTSSPSLGPLGRGVGEATPTVFISVPWNVEDMRATSSGGFYIYQVSSANLFKIDGQGWLPINFASMLFPSLNSLPVDPINSYTRSYFYSYVFRRSDNTFEINANLEYPGFRSGGAEDKEGTDRGNNQNLYEVGTNKSLMNNVYPNP